MIDFVYTLLIVPICAALASICVCRLNYLDPQESKPLWIARYLALGTMAAAVGFEAILNPKLFTNENVEIFFDVVGLVLCSASLWGVLRTRGKWIRRYRYQQTDQAPPESNRAQLGEF